MAFHIKKSILIAVCAGFSLSGMAQNYKVLSKGFNLGYRAGLSRKQNELLAGYYFSVLDRKRHNLLTFDQDLTTNFKSLGFNSSISYSNGFIGLTYSTDLIQSEGKIRVLPGIGVSLNAADLMSLGVFYHYQSTKDLWFPALSLRLMIRPSFIYVLFENADGSDW